MSVTDAPATLRMCPVCQKPMADMDTICEACRAELDTYVMAVKAEDFPEPPPQTSEPTDDLGVPVAAAMDPQVVAAVAQDPDLLPLAPLDEPRIAAAAIAAASSIPSPTVAPAAARRDTPAPTPISRTIAAPVPPVVERAVNLEATSRAKPIIITIVCVALTAVLAAIIWSMIVPLRSVDTSSQGTAPAKTPSTQPAD